mmetsp:Transcript_24048/g.65057  ORF Transcript_24048/g.65057 Transcript_24048/m.65057 type:complete len:138 (-) Transcript_24048:452-865(-)
MSEQDRQAQEILAHLQQLKDQRQQIMSKIAELDAEHSEHNLVISTLEPLEPNRRCFRMIGEVLVERTNAEVLQAVIQSRDNLKKAMGEMAEVLKGKERELLDFVKKHNIRQTNDMAGLAKAASGVAKEEEKSTGVLV